MSVSAPSRLLLQSLQVRPRSCTHGFSRRGQQHRSIFGFGRKREVVDLEKAQKISEGPKDAASEKKEAFELLNSGGLSQNIFDTETKAPQIRKDKRSEEQKQASVSKQKERNVWREAEEGPRASRRLEDLKPTSRNPRPSAILRWERKMAIRDVCGRNRLTKAEKILRTERSYTKKSPMIKTSVKKLGALARQISGKPLDQAIIQMRYSKRLAAKDVLRQLKSAKNEGAASKGLGLGGEVAKGVEKPPPKGLEAELEKKGKVLVEDRDGKKRLITNRHAIYVDEAWVGRGSYGREAEWRAMGRRTVLRPPYTSITLVLKEEATRMRRQEDREHKRRLKPVWVQLPDKLITAQRQYPLW